MTVKTVVCGQYLKASNGAKLTSMMLWWRSVVCWLHRWTTCWTKSFVLSVFPANKWKKSHLPTLSRMASHITQVMSGIELW